MTPEDRERLLILAASRGAFVACVQPLKSLPQAARPFNYQPRTFEGDAFETAFLWARENIENDLVAKSQVPT